MSESFVSREKVLSNVRKALINKSDVDFSNVDFESEIFPIPTEPLEFLFAEKFKAINGKFLFCENKEVFGKSLMALIAQNNWTNIFCFESSLKQVMKENSINYLDSETDFLSTNIGITLCECLVARTGSVFITSKQISGRRLPVFSNIHIVVAYTSQVLYNIKDAIQFIKNKYGEQLPSMIANISGPSRTADIEKTLVQGAHGPKEIYVILIDDHLKNQSTN